MTQQQSYSRKNHTDLEWDGGLWVKHALKGKNSKHHGKCIYREICIYISIYVTHVKLLRQL